MERLHQTDHEQLPKFISHKIVHAAKITGMTADPKFTEDTRLIFGDIDKWILVERSWMKRNGPVSIGGYYVVYEDGYRSYSPGKQFEQGYTAASADTKTTSDVLADPESVFVNMMRGSIAKPSLRSIVNLYAGEVLNSEEALHLELLKLRAEIEELKAKPIVLPRVDTVMGLVLQYQNKERHNVTGTTNWAANIGMVVVDEVARLNKRPGQ